MQQEEIAQICQHYMIDSISSHNKHYLSVSQHYPSIMIKTVDFQNAKELYNLLQRLYNKLNSEGRWNCLYVKDKINLSTGKKAYLYQYLQECIQVRLADKFLSMFTIVYGSLDIAGCHIDLNKNYLYKSFIRKSYYIDLFQASIGTIYWQQIKQHLLRIIKDNKQQKSTKIFIIQGKAYKKKCAQQLINKSTCLQQLALYYGHSQFLIQLSKQFSSTKVILQDQNVKILRQGQQIFSDKLVKGEIMSSFIQLRQFQFQSGHKYILQDIQNDLFILNKTKEGISKTKLILFRNNCKKRIAEFVRYISQKYDFRCISVSRLRLGYYLQLYSNKDCILLGQLQKDWQPNNIFFKQVLRNQPDFYKQIDLSKLQLYNQIINKISLSKQLFKLDISFSKIGKQEILYNFLLKLPPNISDINLEGLAIRKQLLTQLHIKNAFRHVQKIDLSHNLLTPQHLSMASSNQLLCLKGLGLSNRKDPIKLQISRAIKQDRLSLSSKISILHLDCYIDIADLHLISHLPLQQLIIRLTQQRLVFFRSQAKQFAQRLNKKLLRLDISHSLIKLKHLKYILGMPLQQLKLNFCNKVGQECDPISGTIHTLQINQLHLPFKSMRNLLGAQNTQKFRSVSINNTSMTKQQLVKLIFSLKLKLITNLHLLESQFHLDLCQTQSMHLTIQRINISLSTIDKCCQKYLYFFLSKKPVNFIVPVKDVQLLQNNIIKYAHHIHANSIRISINGNKVAYNYPDENKVEPTINYQSVYESKILNLSKTKVTDSQLFFILNYLKDNKSNLLQINIQNCRCLSKKAINIIKQLYPNIQSLNIQGCVFQFTQVQQKLLQLIQLKNINKGYLNILWKKQQSQQWQKSLAFMLRSRLITNLNIKIECLGDQTLVFQLLSIIVQVNNLMSSLSLTLKNFNFKDSMSQLLWDALSSHSLKKLQIIIDKGKNIKQAQINRIIEIGSHFQHFIFTISQTHCPNHPNIFSSFNSKYLKRLQLVFDQCWWVYSINKDLLNALKSVKKLQSLSLGITYNNQLNAHGFYNSLFKMIPMVKNLSLWFEGSSFSRQGLSNLVQYMKENKQITRLQLNVTGCILTGSEFMIGQLLTLLKRNKASSVNICLNGCKCYKLQLQSLQYFKDSFYSDFRIQL